MKYNQLFYNYNGIFRYMKLGNMFKDLAPKPIFNMVQSLVRSRLENGKWRKLGLWTDDLITDEHDVTKEALDRLPKEVLYSRYQRYKVALHYNLLRKELPQDQWVTNEQDKPYLTPFIQQVLSEYEEREKYDLGLFARK